MRTKTNDNAQPVKKRATNRDVAKMAGVSVATVSYVVNGREDQHISEATKKRVFHIINLKSYDRHKRKIFIHNFNVEKYVENFYQCGNCGLC